MKKIFFGAGSTLKGAYINRIWYDILMLGKEIFNDETDRSTSQN
jgi:hypothetical protein